MSWFTEQRRAYIYRVLDVATGEPVVKPPTPGPTPETDYGKMIEALNKNTAAVEANTDLLNKIYRTGN